LLTVGGGVCQRRASDSDTVLTKLGIGEWRLGAPPATGKASTGAANSYGSPGAVGVARGALFWHDSDMGCKIGFALGNHEILAHCAPIYRVFCTISCAARPLVDSI
jgi:hypothetical protein